MKEAKKNLVFIVDDDPDDRQIILDAFLENNSLSDYVFVESADELLEILHSAANHEYPSLILLDLNMPGMLGMQALKEIKSNKRFSDIPTVVLTTSKLSTDRKLSYELGANCFLTKPTLYSELVSITKSIADVWLQ
jgi:CheY-like chemotaxis protein